MTTTDRLAEIEARLSEVRERVADDHETLRRRPTLLLSVTQNDRQVLARHVGLLVAVVREVEALHAPDPVDPTTCRACSDIGGDIAWPCPTAIAVQKLGGAS